MTKKEFIKNIEQLGFVPRVKGDRNYFKYVYDDGCYLLLELPDTTYGKTLTKLYLCSQPGYIISDKDVFFYKLEDALAYLISSGVEND